MKRFNRLWALLLSLALMITYMPLMTFAETEETPSEPVASEDSENHVGQELSESVEDDSDTTALSEEDEQSPAADEEADNEEADNDKEIEKDEEADIDTDADDVKDREATSQYVSDPKEPRDGGKKLVKALEQNDAPSKSSGGMSYSYDSSVGLSVREWQYTPAETGYYAVSAAFYKTSEYNGEREITIDIYQGDICLGELFTRDLDYSVHSNVGTLYLEKDKEYRFYLKDVFSIYSYSFTGSIDLIPVQASCIDEMFTVSNGVLKDYTGNLVTVTIPEGVKSAAYDVYSKMADDYSHSVRKVSITFPSTMEEIVSEDINAISNDGIPCTYFTVAEDSPYFKSENGIVYSKDGTSLVAAPNYIEMDYLEIPEGVTSVEEHAFTGGYNFSGGVETIKLPDSLTEIGYAAFYNAHNLKQIEFGSAVTAIDDNAFYNSGLETVEIPATVKRIRTNAFGSCHQLETVTFGAGNIHAGYWAFVGCENIKTLNINGNAYFENEAFSKCGSIANFNIGNSATEWEVVNDCLINNYDSENHLHDYEFVSDDSYTSKELVLVSSDYSDEELIIEDSIDEVHSEALYGANNIKSVVIGKKIESIILQTDLESIALSSGNTHFQVKDNVLYETEYDYIDGEYQKTGKLVLVKYPMLNDVTDYAVADDVGFIGQEAFATYTEGGSYPLAMVVIPKDTEFATDVFKIMNMSRESDIIISGYDDSPAHQYYQRNRSYESLAWDSRGDSSRVRVTFDPNGGTVSQNTVSRKIGSVIGTLPKPTKKGRVFLGWYTKKTGGSKITAKTVVKKDTTYYAHWGFKVKFNANGGKASKASVNVAEGAAIGKLPTAKKSGMFFLGWYTKKTGGTKVTTKTKIKAGKTFYAHWTKAEIGDAKVTVENCTWNGKARKPEVTVTLKGVKLSSKTDYTVTYSNNKEPGKGKVVIKGKGLFAKSKKTKTAYFKINKAKQVITASDVVYTADKKGKIVNIKIGVKDKAPVTLTSSDPKIVSITTKKADKAKGNIKLVKPGVATITIKTKATAHYLAGSKKVKVTLKGTQKIYDLNASWLTYDKDENVYICNGEVWNKSLGVKLAGQAKAVCTVYENGRNNLAWIESGDCLTARGKGDLVIRVTTEKTAAFPSVTKYFTIRMNGSSLIDNTFSYRQLDSNNIRLITWFGETPEVQIPVRITVDPGNNTTKLVTEVGPSIFAGKQAVTKVTFPKATDDTIKSIGKEAFKGCTGLQEVRLPAGLTSLGEGAFSGCTTLSKITMPDKIKILPKNAFENCSSLDGTFYLPNSTSTVEERALYGCSGIRRVMFYSYIKSVGENAFYGCTGIKNVYYSASEARWNSIQFASGNEAVTVNATMHFNAATPSAYGSDYVPTDHELFDEHPEFLNNESYSTVVEILQSDMLQHLSTADIDLAALKSVMMGGATEALQAWLEDKTSNDGITWSQEELEKALALDLIKDVASEDEVEEVKKKYMDRFNKIYEVVGEFKSEGDDIFENDTTRYRFAQALSGCFEGDHRHDFNEMLKRIQPYWKPDSSNPNGPNWSITGIYKAAGKSIEATDYVLEVIMLNELYRDYIDEVMPYIPEDTSLYRGFSQVKYMMDRPFEDFALTMLREDATRELMKLTVDSIKNQLGTMSVVETICKVIGIAILVPTIDDYNYAWLSLSNSIKLGQMLDDVNSRMIANQGGDNNSLADDQKMIAMMYFQAVKTAGKYTLNTLKYDDDEAYFKQKLDRYEGALNYSRYIQSCKENLVESGVLY